MANRAYLFSTDRADCWGHDYAGSGVYYDSRHTIPIAWWLLFEPADVRLIELERADPIPPQLANRKYKRVRFRSERYRAIERSAKRRTLLNFIVEGRIEARRVDFFEAILRNWTGQYLVMHPDEILEGSEEDEFARSLGAVQILTSPEPDIDEFLRLWRGGSTIPSESDDPDVREVKVLGYTYGELANRLWKEIVEDKAGG